MGKILIRFHGKIASAAYVLVLVCVYIFVDEKRESSKSEIKKIQIQILSFDFSYDFRKKHMAWICIHRLPEAIQIQNDL
jgi:hypothetical protein